MQAYLGGKRGNWVVPDIEKTYSNNLISPKFKAMNVPTEMLCYFIVFFYKSTLAPSGARTRDLSHAKDN